MRLIIAPGGKYRHFHNKKAEEAASYAMILNLLLEFLGFFAQLTYITVFFHIFFSFFLSVLQSQFFFHLGWLFAVDIGEVRRFRNIICRSRAACCLINHLELMAEVVCKNISFFLDFNVKLGRVLCCFHSP